MKFNTPLYYCTECKTILASLDKLLFVEEESSKGFCSESCIEDFYIPLIRHFETLEFELRNRLGISKELENEQIIQHMSDKELVDEVLSSPSEIWKNCNELDEDIFTYIKHFPDYSGIVICKVYNAEASFVFLSTLTRSRQFLAEIRVGEKINLNDLSGDSSELNELEKEFSEEDFIFMQLLENKKSVLLAELLEKRKEDDISFEDFSLYEACFSETIENPDEVFENKDYEGDLLFIYIKSYIKDNENYFYIISCLKRKENDESNEVNVFPILAFPTNDLDLYSGFRIGKKIAGHINN
ncbi:MAG: hypothetical protein Q7U04_14045 [Bacteriovorax sp.]|nr:hypothetical protein [Bacteriovorax sp.]